MTLELPQLDETHRLRRLRPRLPDVVPGDGWPLALAPPADGLRELLDLLLGLPG